MLEKYINAQELQNMLLADGILNAHGIIKFKLGNIETIIKTRDIIGNSLQSWLKEWLIENNIFFLEATNTQEFPDFYLSFENPKDNMVEVKAFNNNASPAFDIANFESYCDSLRTDPYRLFADYIIIGYILNPEDGIITIKNVWLKKIWEITGKSRKFPLRTQTKREMIYNIRPINWYTESSNSFKSVEEFVYAIYSTLEIYKDKQFANEWLNDVKEAYYDYYSKDLDVNFS